MKEIFAAAIFLASLAVEASALTVAWDPNPPAENVTNYVVHHGPTSRAAPGFAGYPNKKAVGTATQAVLDVPVGTYIAVTAENQYGLSSDYSVELRVTDAESKYTIPSAPSGSSGSCAVVDGLGRTITFSCTTTTTVNIQ